VNQAAIVAILVENYDAEWAEVVNLTVGHHVTGDGCKQFNPSISSVYCSGLSQYGSLSAALILLCLQGFGQAANHQDRYSSTHAPAIVTSLLEKRHLK